MKKQKAIMIAALSLSFLFTQNNSAIAEEGVTVSSYIYIDGSAVEVPKDIDKVVLEVINGKWGNGTERVSKLAQFGYDYSEVQSKVNEIMAAYEAEQNRIAAKKVERKEKEKKKIEKKVEKTEIKSVKKTPQAETKKTTVKSNTTKSVYSLRDLQFHGVINWGGYKFTYYSQSVLPGGGLTIPGRHINAGGYVADKDGYIVLANDAPKGTVINTPFGYKGKVYDRGTYGNHFDVYTK